jgi:hypothetical protein
VRIEPWGAGDRSLLEQTLSDPAMTQHLGGPESSEKIAERQAKYEQPSSGQFKIVLEPTGEGVGWVGFWERTWQGEEVYEIGWSVLTAFQGRGIAARATAQRSKPRARRASTASSTTSRRSTTHRRMRSAGRPASRCWASTTSNTRPGTRCAPTTGASTSPRSPSAGRFGAA